MLQQVRQELIEALERNGVSGAHCQFEVPKKLEQGHLALPVFRMAKELRVSPQQIAVDLAKKMSDEKIGFLSKVEPLGGFVNFTIQDESLQKVLTAAVREQGERLGYSQAGSGKKLIIDYSSPNVAKPMSIGHLRATVIGQAIRNLAETQGFKVVGINHLGDWGVQFGKLAWAFENWGHEYPFAEKPFESLYQLYVRFHEQAEQDPELDRLGSAAFRKLEEGDEKISAIWKKFLDISLKEYQRLWDRLGVRHDLVRGESFFNDRLRDVELRLEKAGLLQESDGAMVVHLGEDMPPCLIRKADGSSLYATRDLAAAIYRREELGADLNLYVVGIDQNLHFKQIFEVLKRMDYPWWDTCHHISFGMYRFKDGRMSTRKGNVIFLEDVLNKSVDLVKQLIQEKNPDLGNKDLVAEQVGVGAIIFNDLINDRVKNVDFDWQRVLDFDGASGPYVQYCVVRCNSLMKKYGKPVAAEFAMSLSSDEERELIKTLVQYPDILQKAFESFKPHVLAQYLVDACRSFNHFYQKHRILGEEPAVEQSRMVLVHLTGQVLRSGLKVLNIQSPDAM